MDRILDLTEVYCPVPTTKSDEDFWLEVAAAHGALLNGFEPGLGSGVSESLLFAVALQQGVSAVPASTRHWSEPEREFVRQNIHRMSDGEIAAALGRSKDAVKIYRQRKLKLPSTTRLPEQPSLNQVARLFGVDSHSVIKWADRDMIQSRDTGLGIRVREGAIRTVDRAYLKWWALQPENWMLFKAERITDPALRRLVLAKQVRWGDEWITSGEIARMWGCDKRLVNSVMCRGRLTAGVRWGNWYFRKGEVLRVKQPGRGKGGSTLLAWPVGQDVFLVLAYAIGLSFTQIEQMGTWNWRQLQGRYQYLRSRNLLRGVVVRSGLLVSIRGAGVKTETFVDWRLYRDRFPGLARAIERFKEGRPRPRDLDSVQAVLRAWARWYGPYDLAQSLIFSGRGRARHKVRVARLMSAWQQLRESGIEPL